MLIQFSVKNFRSLRDMQTLSLARGAGEELETENSVQLATPGAPALLRSAVLYGPNAGGKSNLVKALTLMEWFVTESATDRQHGDSLPYEPFKLDLVSSTQPTEFEASFISNGVRYQYGFAYTKDRIHEEWLYAYPVGRAQKWIDRKWNAETKAYEWGKMSGLSGTKQIWQKNTRSNSLFLSQAVQLNSEQLQPVFAWFKRTLRVAHFNGWANSYSAKLCRDDEARPRVIKFLKAADLDIDDVHVEVEKFNPSDVKLKELPEALRQVLIDQIQDRDQYAIQTFHRNSKGDLVAFELEEESDGTKKFFAFAGPWIDVLENGYVLVIDELHNSLHPKMVKFLVDMFHSETHNPKNAQLIFTTHETSILNQETFRRDQIWFCQKDADKATVIYPLTDFSPRKERENLEVSYLAGRYGGLPFIRSLIASDILKQVASGATP